MGVPAVTFEAGAPTRLEPAEIAGMLIALRVKGETPAEMIGAAKALFSAATPFDRPDYLFADCCGTGGDGSGSINVSTATALVAAACGLPVAKHGNRSVSSRCGSADVLQALGVRLDVDAAAARHDQARELRSDYTRYAALANEGARVACIDLSEQNNAETMAQIGAIGGTAISIGADVTRTADVERIVARTVTELGLPNILFNNAGADTEDKQSILKIDEAALDL